MRSRSHPGSFKKQFISSPGVTPFINSGIGSDIPEASYQGQINTVVVENSG